MRRRLSFAWIALLVVLFLREALFGGRILYDRDLHQQWYGQAERFVACLGEGAWPLWDPYVSFGQPLLANANNQLLYPFSWLHIILRPWTYYTLFLGAHLVFAAWGLLLLGRKLGLSPFASLLAASLWVSSGPLLSLGNLWNHLAAAAWMPWVVLASEAALVSGSARAVVVLGAAIALQIATGSPELTAMTGLLATACAARRWHWRRPVAASHRRALGAGLAALLLALLLSAAQWLPSLELAADSSRRNLGPVEATSWSIHPLGLLQAALPVFWQDLPLNASWRTALFDDREPYLYSIYVGLPGLLLAGLAIRRRRDPLVLGLFGLALLATLFALGRHSFFFRLLFDSLPLLRVLRFPAKALILVGLCVALLAGVGADAWREPRGRRGFATAAGIVLCGGLGLALLASLLRFDADTWAPLFLAAPAAGESNAGNLALAWAGLAWGAAMALACFGGLAARARGGPLLTPASALAIGLLGVADLAWTHRDLQSTAPRQLVTFVPDVVQAVDQHDRGRLFVYDYGAAPGLSRRHLNRDKPYVVMLPRRDPSMAWLGAFSLRVYLLPPTGAAHGLYSSYERDLLRIQPSPVVGLNAVLAYTDGTPLQGRMLRLAAVRQVVSLHDPGLPGVTELRRFEAPFLEPMRLFDVADTRPRSYVVGGVRVADGKAGLDTLLAPDFDLAHEIVLPSGTPRPAGPGFRGSSEVVEMKADRVRLRSESNAPGHAVLVDAYDPGWQVRLDGRPVPLLRANVAFRAVAVPAGRHEIEMVYRPASVLVGAAISGIGLVACAALLARRRRAPCD